MSNDYLTAKKYVLKLATNGWMYEFPSLDWPSQWSYKAGKSEYMYLLEMSLWNRKLLFAINIIKTSLDEIALKKSIWVQDFLSMSKCYK